jgi:hypothetical protein
LPIVTGGRLVAGSLRDLIEPLPGSGPRVSPTGSSAFRFSFVAEVSRSAFFQLHFPELLEERSLVVVDRLPLLGLAHFDPPLVLPLVEDRLKERREEVPVRGRPIEELAQVGARNAERPGEADPGDVRMLDTRVPGEKGAGRRSLPAPSWV